DVAVVTVGGHEHLAGHDGVGAVGHGEGLAVFPAEGHRGRHQVGVGHRVVGDPHGGGVGQGLEAHLDDVGGVVPVPGVGRVRVVVAVGVVVPAVGGAAAVVVPQAVLVEELARPVGAAQ